MKNKKKILSLLACLSLLTSCNKSTPSSSSCKVTTSTPSVDPTPTPEPDPIEPINPVDYIKFEKIESKDNLTNGTLCFYGFSDLTAEQKLTVTEFTFPEEIDGIKLTTIHCSNYFSEFKNLKKITISKNVIDIEWVTSSSASTPFGYIPSLEEIIVEEGNEWYYTKGNSLIEKRYTINSDGSRNITGSYQVICGWKDVEIPDEITSLSSYNFSNQESITTIKLNPNIDNIKYNAIRRLKNLSNIYLNGNTKYKIENNVLYDPSNISVCAAWGDIVFPIKKQFSIEDCYSVTSVVIPEGIQEIASFKGSKIKSINIPASVTNFIGAFLYCPSTVNEVTVDSKNTKFKAINNCVYNYIDNTFIGCVGDVLIPENITSLDASNAFYYNYSIKSIKFPKTFKFDENTGNTGQLFVGAGGNDGFKLKISIDEENPTFKVKSNCIVKIDSSTNYEIVLYALPDSEGNVVLPESATIFASASFYYESMKAKSVKFNEGLKEIKKPNNNDKTSVFSSINKISELVLPSTIENIETGTYAPFKYLQYLTNVSIRGGENNYYKMEGNCLIKKDSDSSKDEVIFGYGDVVVPDRITTLNANTFKFNYSITSITLHNKFTSVDETALNSIKYSSSNTSKFEEINYLGTLDEFKKKIGSGKSLYEIFKISLYNDVTLNYLDSNGAKLSCKISELE